jgi:thiol-disulfide isomerase/thioredoxin
MDIMTLKLEKFCKILKQNTKIGWIIFSLFFFSCRNFKFGTHNTVYKEDKIYKEDENKLVDSIVGRVHLKEFSTIDFRDTSVKIYYMMTDYCPPCRRFEKYTVENLGNLLEDSSIVFINLDYSIERQIARLHSYYSDIKINLLYPEKVKKRTPQQVLNFLLESNGLEKTKEFAIPIIIFTGKKPTYQIGAFSNNQLEKLNESNF